MAKKVRQYACLIMAVVVYFLIHEGAHALVALYYGVFESIRFLGVGIQVVVDHEAMTETQIGIFCLVGAVSTLIAGWAFLLMSRTICSVKSAYVRTFGWYVTMVLLILDPLYLSVLYRYVGGGDMNGIQLLVPELAAQITFGALLGINAIAMVVLAYKPYKESFQTA